MGGENGEGREAGVLKRGKTNKLGVANRQRENVKKRMEAGKIGERGKEKTRQNLNQLNQGQSLSLF